MKHILWNLAWGVLAVVLVIGTALLFPLLIVIVLGRNLYAEIAGPSVT